MANPSVGTKFVSVNLNKSYGQQHGQGHYHHQHHNGGSSFHGISSGGRGRGVGGGGGYGGGSGGSGGMVVLSRPRSSQKAGPKLSVPPPLNLPSLRKEHEKFDVLGSGSGVGASGISGGGMRPGASGIGWTKPASGTGHYNNEKVVPDTDDKGRADGNLMHGAVSRADLGVNASTVYMPPSARLSGGPAGPGYAPVVEKAAVLRGEDFPSLRAAVPVAANAPHKPKDSLSKKQDQAVSEKFGDDEGKLILPSSALVDMRPQVQSSRNVFANSDESQVSDQNKKTGEYFSGPLPIVRLNPRSDWADDERDTGLGLVDRGRDPVYKNETYWDGDFDMPRASHLPRKPASNPLSRWGQRDDDTAKSSTSEVHKPDTYHHDRNGRAASREGKDGNSWRSSSLLRKQGFNYQDLRGDGNGPIGRSSLYGAEMKSDNKYAGSAFLDGATEDFGRRQFANIPVQPPWNHSSDSLGSRAKERNYRDHNVSERTRYNGNILKGNSAQTSSFGSRGLSSNDSVLDIARNIERRNVTKNDKSYMEDSFLKDFDHGSDPLAGSLVGVVKRKKDTMKSEEVYDPVRESFEAELERVQKLQEQERQRMIEEQERVFELARREEEERARRAREQEELQRRLEEEAREAELRAEEERQNALRRAEEQRIAREEEKQRILMEEERRKQAAKKKLLELEERIARRQAGVALAGSTSSDNDSRAVGLINEKDDTQVTEICDWEDSEKMVERLTSASLDFSSQNRPFDTAGNATLRERGKFSNSWRRAPFPTASSSNFGLSEQDGYSGTRRDPSFGERVLPGKELYNVSGYATSRNYPKGGFPEHQMEQPRLQRWNLGNGNDFNQNTEIDTEYHGNFVERHAGDVDWGQCQSLPNFYSPSSEQIPQVAEADGSYSFGRSRYSMRQPRVLPPPTLSSMHKNSYRGEVEHPGPSAVEGNERHFATTSRIEMMVDMNNDNNHQEYAGRNIDSEITVEPSGNEEAMIRCDSQSSLSVSSAPDSPVHLSHDDPDESRGYPEESSGVDKELVLSGNGVVLTPVSSAQENVDVSGSAYSEDEGEWSMENDELVQEQEEYDEDGECYQEEEARDGNEDTLDENQEFDDIREENTSSPDNLVVGFDEVVVLMPNDEVERNLGTELVDYAVPSRSISNIETHLGLGGVGGDVMAEEQIDSSNKSTIPTLPKMLQKTDKDMDKSVIDVDNKAVEPAASRTFDNSEASGVSVSDSLASHPSGDPILPTAPVVPARTEIPVNLKFGLFSGPPLVPSPVPAIQIGSIQMPLHLHSHVLSSPGTMPQSQTPIFQFGQLRYSSPVSPGVIPLASHSLSFLHSNGPVNFSSNQHQDGPSTVQAGHSSAQNSATINSSGSQAVESPPGLVPRESLSHEDDMIKKSSAASVLGAISHGIKQDGGVEHYLTIGSNTLPSHPVQEQGRQNKSSRNDGIFSTSRKREGQAFSGAPSTSRNEKDVTGLKVNGSISGRKFKQYIFKVKNASSQPSHPETDPSDPTSAGYNRRLRRSVKRTEFRVRETGEVRRSGVIGSITNIDDRTIATGRRTSRSWSANAITPKKLSKEVNESNIMSSSAAITHESDSIGGNSVRSSNQLYGKGHAFNQPLLLEQQSSSNPHEEDIDANLESGVVCIFEQPGIEVPSDEDDFIEVRSKRQMLHDKREQREKEIKAKSHIAKSTYLSSVSRRNTSLRSGGTSKSVNTEMPAVLSKTSVAQSLPPIGTPTAKNDARADSSSQKIKSAGTVSHTSIPENIQSDVMFDGTNKVINNVESLDSWRNSGISQQVMQLTQSQLDEAMKPAEFDTLASAEDHNISVTETIMPSTSVLPKDKSFSSAASPINSLLAGEKIQFGAVTSPTVIPSSRHSVSHGIGPPGSLSDVQMPQKLPTADNDRSIFFDKERNSSESCPHLEDCEAEAEAAASAVAVAVISSDEIVGNDLSTRAIAVSDTKTFGASEIGGTSTGIGRDQRSTAQSRTEEPLNVSLPADLSIDTPPISLWQPLKGQTTSSQMLSHFRGGPPSNYPFYEMNPLLGSPIFAFGPNEDSGSSRQASSAPTTGPPARWQTAHSGLDSFYGPPAGFTGPFIGPGGIQQGPPHMVVYNHFAPVGQFGQVGLSFMGTTFIPSGRQPDWKHNPAPSPTVVDGDMKNMNVGPSLHNDANMPPPVQTLAPGSPLLPMAAAIFDAPPFQSSPDMSVSARWPHIPSTQLQAASVGMPIQPQGGVPPQFRNGHSIDQSLNASRFSETHTSSPEGGRNFSSASDANANRWPDGLALLDPANSSSAVSIPNVAVQSSSSNASGNAGNIDLQSTDNKVSGSIADSTRLKIHPSQHKGGFSQNNVSSSSYNNQWGVNSQKGGEWAHRRGGFHGRNHSLGAEKGLSSSKVKQIYVAKQTLVAKPATS
ncbi:hypothetical protein MLD38_028893 [Melastoma candidum]|uniref:Uncharacterized protein n=1 Tax=Melastoma candidum TaxID=119954 RepID=A0ACB9N830_9MYRT|nr:hypothetical protein MLD38_028893 [Melastoma candidum]